MAAERFVVIDSGKPRGVLGMVPVGQDNPQKVPVLAFATPEGKPAMFATVLPTGQALVVLKGPQSRVVMAGDDGKPVQSWPPQGFTAQDLKPFLPLIARLILGGAL